MNWEWAMRRARQLSWIFLCRYKVYGTRHVMGPGFHVYVYEFKRVDGRPTGHQRMFDDV